MINSLSNRDSNGDPRNKALKRRGYKSQVYITSLKYSRWNICLNVGGGRGTQCDRSVYGRGVPLFSCKSLRNSAVGSRREMDSCKS